jgi:protein-tyrosine phosphatase
MEKRHKQIITQKFGMHLNGKTIIVLDIPDEYQFMNPELIESLEVSVIPYLNAFKSKDK